MTVSSTPTRVYLVHCWFTARNGTHSTHVRAIRADSPLAAVNIANSNVHSEAHLIGGKLVRVTTSIITEEDIV